MYSIYKYIFQIIFVHFALIFFPKKKEKKKRREEGDRACFEESYGFLPILLGKL